MSQLHHDPVLDEAAVPAPGSGTPLDAPAEAAQARSAPAHEAGAPTIPAQRAGDPVRRRLTRGSRWGARAVTARLLPPERADDSSPEAHLAGAEDLAGLAGLAEATALAGLEEVAPDVHDLPPLAPDAEPDPAVDPAADPTASDSPADHAAPDTVPGVLRSPSRSRRPVLVVAAAFVAAAGLGLVTGGDPRAQAEASEPPVSESVSVARALGIEGVAGPVPVADEAEQLAELAASRASRDLEQFTAAVVQDEADRRATEWLAAVAAENARPDAVLPVQGARLTSGFGARWGTVHAGIDLAAPMLTPEYAAMDGVVLQAGPASGYGNAVYIQHENGDVTVYGHMEEILVAPGQVVRAGDTVALLGNRGQSTGPHLHFEVRVGGLNGTKIDPVPWLRERGVQI